MKYILTLFLLLFSITNMQAKEKIYPTNDMIFKVFNKTENSPTKIDNDNLEQILSYVDEQQYFSDYKKHLIKNLSMLNYKATLSYQNEKELLRIAKYIFPLSMCAAYQFRDDLMRIMEKTSSFYIKDIETKNNFMKSFEKMGTLYLNEAQNDFNPEIDFFAKKCSN